MISTKDSHFDEIRNRENINCYANTPIVSRLWINHQDDFPRRVIVQENKKKLFNIDQVLSKELQQDRMVLENSMCRYTYFPILLHMWQAVHLKQTSKDTLLGPQLVDAHQPEIKL